MCRFRMIHEVSDGFDREDERAKKRSESLDGLDESDSVVGDLCD